MMETVLTGGYVLLRAFLLVFLACAAAGGLLTGAAGVFTLGARLLRPKKERREEALLRAHRFYAVSGQGRAAYLLLCLEAALTATGQDTAAWTWLLERLWRLPSTPLAELRAWEESFGALLPESLFAYGPEQLIPAGRQTPDTPSAEERRAARALYSQAGAAMMVLDPLLVSFYALVNLWDGDDTPHQPEGLSLLECAETVLERFSIPLPQDQAALARLLEQRDPFWGAPFPGRSLSSLLPEQESADPGDIKP